MGFRRCDSFLLNDTGGMETSTCCSPIRLPSAAAKRSRTSHTLFHALEKLIRRSIPIKLVGIRQEHGQHIPCIETQWLEVVIIFQKMQQRIRFQFQLLPDPIRQLARSPDVVENQLDRCLPSGSKELEPVPVTHPGPELISTGFHVRTVFHPPTGPPEGSFVFQRLFRAAG